MTQTSVPTASKYLFARFKAWFLAIPYELAPAKQTDGKPSTSRETAEDDDGFYLALDMYRHW